MVAQLLTRTNNKVRGVDSHFLEVARKVENGERLTREEGCWLYEFATLDQLRHLAGENRISRHGKRAFYVVNRHINYSNLCILACDFCAFGKRRRDDGSYEFSIDEMVERANQAMAAGANELHIVGGLHPTWKFDHYLEMLRALRAVPGEFSIKAFTAIEVLHLSWVARQPVERVLADLRDAGLGCLTGGGAEIFEPSVREVICKGKETGEEWLEVHRVAHQLGIPTTATMLFGHLETYAHRIDHLVKLRDLQDETGGFIAFLPLAFQPAHRLSHLPEPSREAILRNMAVCRLLLDNFDHVKAYWIRSGLDLAAESLHFGADDLDGTIGEEKIYHMAGVSTPVSQSELSLQAAIRDAGYEPVRRNCFYDQVVPAA